MQNTWKEIYKIWSAQQLREELGLWADIEIPEIKQTIEFTREEWMQLKNEISDKDWLWISEVLKTILEQKLRQSTDISQKSVIERTWIKADALRNKVGEWIRLENWNHDKEILVQQSSAQYQSQEQPKPNTDGTQSETSLIEKWKEWASEHPILATWAALWTVFVWYKAISWLFWWDESSSHHESSKWDWDEKEGFIDWLLEKIWIKWDYAKWAKKLWVLWLVVAAWIWLFMWKDKIEEYWEKAKEYFGFENEDIKNAFANFSKLASANGNKVEIKPEVIKKIKWEKIKDFISIRGKITSTIQDYAKQWMNYILPDVVKKLWISADEGELKQIESLQVYLENEIKEWRLTVSDETTIGDLVYKLSGNAKLISEADKNLSHKIVLWKWAEEPTKQNAEEYDWASPYPVLTSRTYQLYYWVFAPWNKMSLVEKNYIMSYWPKFWDKFWKDTDFISARKSLPWLENEYKLLAERVWPLTKEESSLLVLLEQRIQSIKAWPKAFKEFNLLFAQWPEVFLSRVDKLWADIEARSLGLGNRDKLRNWDIQQFKDTYLQHERLLREQNAIVWKLNDEIWEIDKQIATATNSNDIIRLKAIKDWKLEQIIKIEENVTIMTEKFVKYQEHAVPLLKNEKWIKLTLAWWIKTFKWQEIDSISHLKINPEKQFFRLGSLKWAVVLTWLWIGASAYLSMDKDGKIDWKQVLATWKRIGAWFIPIYWTKLDLEDAIHSFKSGDMLWWAANSAAFVASLAWDVLLWISIAGSLWIWTPVGLAAKAGTWTIRGALKSWIAWIEASKLVKATKTTAMAGTFTALALWVWVPIASWAFNSEWKIEKQDHSNINRTDIDYID